MRDGYEVDLLPSGDYQEWNSFMASWPQGSIFSTSFWMRAMEEATEKPFRIYGCYRKDELVGGLALQVFKKGPFRVGAMPPLTPFTGIVVRPDRTGKFSLQESRRKQIMEVISDRLVSDFDFLTFSNHPCLRDLRPLKWKGWRIGVNHTYLVDMRDPKKLWNSFDRSIRTQVRKAEGLGIEVFAGEDISKFYEIYRATFSHKGIRAPVGERFFARAYPLLREQRAAKIYFGQDSKGEVISAYICVWDERRGYFWAGGTNPESRATQVTTLIYWSILKDISQFLPEVDLNGGNTPSIAMFQRNFATSLEPYYQVEHASVGARIVFNLYSRFRKSMR